MDWPVDGRPTRVPGRIPLARRSLEDRVPDRAKVAGQQNLAHRGTMLREFAILAQLAALALAQPLALGAQEHTHAGHGPTLGTVIFPNSGNAAAQAPFLEGVALLHSFEYERAASAFRKAQEADTGFALAYWAEALTYSRVLWRVEDLPASRAVMARLAPTPTDRLAKAGDERERSFGASVEAFYADGTLPERVRIYADQLRSHARAYHHDHEAAAFAAHAIMLDSYVGDPARRDALVREAIDLAQRVAQENPQHPGAVHYLIHLYDNPGMAAEGLEFARAYDQIAPDAEHALHMPSHIYLQLGLWEDVVRSNERAWAASRAHGEEAGGPDWHAFTWLQYGYLQQGRWTEARGLIDSARTILPKQRHPYIDANVVATRLEFQYAAETGEWAEPIAAPLAPSGQAMTERERLLRASARYWQTVDAVKRGDPAAAELAGPYLALADSIRAGAQLSPTLASNALIVDALVAHSQGDRDAYLAALNAAAKHERHLTAFVGPPERIFALELLGAELTAEGQHAEAIAAYQYVLKLCPRRSLAILGLARAKEAAGDQRGAAEAYDELRVNWARADAAVASAARR